MEFVPVNGFVLVKRVSENGKLTKENGIHYTKNCVDLYEVVSISEGDESLLTLRVGDIVTSCATGTPIAETDFILMDPQYITGKIEQ